MHHFLPIVKVTGMVEYPANKTFISTVALWYIDEHNLFFYYPDILSDEVFSDCQFPS